MAWQEVLSKIFIAQLLSFCVSLTGLFANLLAQQKAAVPLLQSASAYLLIFVVVGPVHFVYRRRRALATRTATTMIEDASPSLSSSLQWVSRVFFSTHFPKWRYVVVAMFDVGASYFSIAAYSKTDITSAQLLDDATIVTVMILGYLFLQRRYNWRHMFGVALAIGGMIGLVMADAADKSRDSSKTAPDPVMGDIMMLIAATLYGFTNIACEALLKSESVVFPQWIKTSPLCSCFFSDRDHHQTAPLVVADARAAEELCRSSGSDEAGATSSPLPSSSSSSSSSSSAVSPPSNSPVLADTTAVAAETTAAEAAVAAAPGSTPLAPGTLSTSVWGSLAAVQECAHLIAEYITFLSLFGFIMSFILLFCTSTSDVKELSSIWSWQCTLFQAAFCCAMVGTYVGLPVVLKLTTATFTVLSLITADAYAVVLNYTTSGTAPTALYYGMAAIIVVGTIVYDTADTENKTCPSCDDD